MPNTAYIIGSLNKAIYFDNDKVYALEGNDGAMPYSITGYEWSQIQSLQLEYYVVTFDDIESLRTATKDHYQKAQVLENALELMDSMLSVEYKKGIALIFIEQVDNFSHLRQFVENRLLSTPTPDTFDPDLAFEIVSSLSLTAASLFENLREKTKPFETFYTLLVHNMALDQQIQEAVDQRLTDSGCFRSFSHALYSRSEEEFELASSDALSIFSELNIQAEHNLFDKIKTDLNKLYIGSFGQIKGSLYQPADAKKEDGLHHQIFMAEKYREKGKFEEALEQFDNIISKFPNRIMGFNGKAETLREMGKLAQALQQYEFINNNFPDHIFSLNGRAETLREMGRLEEALFQYEQIVRRFPNHFVSQNGKAETLRDLKRMDQALAQYDLIINKFPQYVVSHYRKADILRRMRMLPEALEQYEKILNIYPENVIAHRAIAEIYQEMGKRDEAIKQYDRIIKKYPDDIVAKSGKARLLRGIEKSNDLEEQYDADVLVAKSESDWKKNHEKERTKLSDEILSLRSFLDYQRTYFTIKRILEVIISVFVIIFLLTWLVPILAIVIKLDSPGPVFFIQRRVGRWGRSFRCIKFRTMRVNNMADVKYEEGRVTRVGRILRKTGLDDIPQFLNVLAGSMSIVGPRPHMHADTDRFSKVISHYKFRNVIRPGITGLAQIKGYRGPTRDFDSIYHRFQFDSFYVRNVSLWLDFRIMRKALAATLGSIFSREKKVLHYSPASDDISGAHLPAKNNRN